MMHSTYPQVAEALLEELLREPDGNEPGSPDGVDDTPDFLRFPNLHDRIEASRDFPSSAPHDLWSEDPWGDDAA
jgi:hypothetical protein